MSGRVFGICQTVGAAHTAGPQAGGCVVTLLLSPFVRACPSWPQDKVGFGVWTLQCTSGAVVCCRGIGAVARSRTVPTASDPLVAGVVPLGWWIESAL